MEIKYGFLPNTQEANAWRIRRRYRLIKGGHPQITLVHYTRGPVIRESRHILVFPPRPLFQIPHTFSLLIAFIFWNDVPRCFESSFPPTSSLSCSVHWHFGTMHYEPSDLTTYFEPRF